MKIIVFKEKHYERYFIAEEEKIDDVFLKVFTERNEKYGLYEIRDPYTEKAYNIATDPDHEKQSAAAMAFMNHRQDYEYEGFESITPETADDSGK